MSDKVLEEFGEFVVKNFRDKALEQHSLMQEGRLRAPELQDIQAQLSSMPDEQRMLVKHIVTDAIDTALHDLLFAFQDAHDRSQKIEVMVDGENIAEKSGMLQGEIQGDSGWIARFSRYK